MIFCQGCKIEQPLQNFEARGDRSGRLRPYCRECSNNIARARYRHHKENSPFKLRCSRAKVRAKACGVPFDLTPEYLESIWTGICPVLKVEIKWETDRLDEFAAELDRFVPELGYVKGNVNFLSRKANRLKNNVTVVELRQLLDWMENAC